MNNNKGLAPILAVLIILGVLALGIAGYLVIKKQQISPQQQTPSPISQETLNNNQTQGEYTDSQKIKDVNLLQKALEQYYDIATNYPYIKSYGQLINVLNEAKIDISSLSSFARDIRNKELVYNTPDIPSNNYLNNIKVDTDYPTPVPSNNYLNNIKVDTLQKASSMSYVLGVRLSDKDNVVLKDSLHGNIAGVNCDSPMYCVQGEYIKKIRDTKRTSDLEYIKKTIAFLEEEFNLDPYLLCKNGKIYRSMDDKSTAVDGTGWIPINFNKVQGGSPYGKLPIDPINGINHYYSFACDPQTHTFELDTKLESDTYQSKTSEDGGNNPNIYEDGTNLKLIN